MPELPEQCMAMLKPAGATHEHRCPMPVVPGEVYCPLHLVLSRRMAKRAERHRKLLRYYREEVEGKYA